jgi:SHS family lactate transporter-like MFS transporter
MYAWWAAWMGWTLDAFDFTVFLLIMVPIAEESHVPLPVVAFVLTIKLWMRLVCAVAAGWLADRVGRKNGRHHIAHPGDFGTRWRRRSAWRANG